MTLEQIVLPLAESRTLAEKGIVLDTAMVWVERPAGWNKYKVITTGDGKYFAPEARAVCPAPVLSELLDAIRAKGYGDIRFDWNLSVPSERRCMAIVANSTNGEHHAYGATDLLAAASLLLEVAK